MNNYLLTWDGVNGHIISNGYRLITDEKFILAFNYDKLYYEPDVGNAFVINTDGTFRLLTVEEIDDIQDFCKYYWEDHDFIVQAYSDSGLFEGAIPKSTAEYNGYNYRVNEIPDHPASKWTGTSWERVVLTVLDNGDVNEWPESICAQCVIGFTQQERDLIGLRPSMYHKWDIVNSRWADLRSLDRAKLDAASSLRVDFELLRHASSTERYFVPSYETETWTWQLLEARSWLLDNSAETPYIDAFLQARTDNNIPTKQALCEDIIKNNKMFLAVMAEIAGLQWSFLSRVKAATSNEECVAIQQEAHEMCVARRATLEV